MSSQKEQNTNIVKLLASASNPSSREDPPDLNKSFESMPDSTQSDNEDYDETHAATGSIITNTNILIDISHKDERQSELRQKIFEA